MAVVELQVLPVIERHRLDLRASGGDLDRRPRDLDARERSAEAAAVKLGEQRPVPAADVERAPRRDARPRAQLDHVLGLAQRAQRAPALIDRATLGVAGVAVLVEGYERALAGWLAPVGELSIFAVQGRSRGSRSRPGQT